MRSSLQFAILAVVVMLAGCDKRLTEQPQQQDALVGPNMRIPLDAVALQMACDDISSIILVSMSNRLSKKDVFETKRYALGLGDTFDQRFPNLPEETRLRVRQAYTQTVSDQYVAAEHVIQTQVETFRTYGEDQFRQGAVAACKRAIANLPAGPL